MKKKQDKFSQLEASILKLVDTINTRFSEIDKRFEEMDKRFEAIDKRFEAIDKRFEAIDKRFETIDKRFDSIDKRFDSIDKRFIEMKQYVDLGFKEMKFYVDKRFNETYLYIDKKHREAINFAGIQFEAVDSKLKALNEKLDDMLDLPSASKEHNKKLKDHEIRIRSIETFIKPKSTL